MARLIALVGRVVMSVFLLRALVLLLGPSRSNLNRSPIFTFTTYMSDGPFEPWEGI